MKDDDDHGVAFPSIFERRIWTFYEWGVIITPILIMLSHWYIFYVFSLNSQEVLNYPKSNEICIAWIYSILYLYVPLMILPASYFFRWCSLFRIPFVYFLFINVERWYYGSWFCTNEMIDTHYILIYCIMTMYAFELTELFIKHFNDITIYKETMEHKEKFLYDALEVFKDMVQKGECSKQDVNYWCGVSGYELERRGASVGVKRWLQKNEASKILNVSTSTFDRIILAGGLPKGKKIQGKKNLLWKREDIEQCKKLMLLKANK